MTLPKNIDDLEKAKFIDDSGNVCLRVVATSTSNTSAPLATSITDLEYNKFVDDDNGDTAIVLKIV